MVAVPWTTLVAKPAVPAALLMVATPTVSDAQVTRDVMSCVLPSV